MATKVTAKTERRRAARGRLAEIRDELRRARAHRKQAMVDAREQCRTDRVAARDRARMTRQRSRAELVAALARERQAVKDACIARLDAARAHKEPVEKARARLAAERALAADLRRVEGEHRARVKAAPSDKRPETDAEVHAHLGSLPWNLGPLFDHVKTKIKGSGATTRTEAMIRYAETHPDELLAASAHPHDVRVQTLEEEEKKAAKEAGCACTPSEYEAKKAARIARLRARAERTSHAAAGAAASARAIADMIPMGQPILVGHHSEKRHRRDLARVHDGFGKAYALENEAKQLERRADRAESNAAIASDDPEAIPKLRAKLADLDKARDRMVATNKVIHTKSGKAQTDALAALGFSASEIARMLVPDMLGRTGFPDYALRNGAGEMARVKRRIADLEADARRPKPAPVVIGDVRIEEADHRVRVIFPSKPAEATRASLKGAGFHWSPQNGAWQRFVSQAAWLAAHRIVSEATGNTTANENARPSPPATPPPAPAQRVKGEGLDTAGIAAAVRQDIKDAIKIGTLPKAKYSVRIDRYSMGSSIDVVASALPFPVLNADAFIVRPGESWLSIDSDRFRSRFTPEAQRVERALNEIVDAYHWNKSDSSTDYYNERFARHVKVEEGPAEKKRIEAAKLDAGRAIVGAP